MHLKYCWLRLLSVALVLGIVLSPSIGLAADDADDTEQEKRLRECCSGLLCTVMCIAVVSSMDVTTYMPPMQVVGESPDDLDHYIEAYEEIVPNVYVKSSFLQRALRFMRAVPAMLIELVTSGG